MMWGSVLFGKSDGPRYFFKLTGGWGSIMEKVYEAIVIGSGFGGGINACRLGKKWPGEVLVLERGKRYPMGSFPRKPHDFARNFWNVASENIDRPGPLKAQEQHGMFDIRNYRHMDVVMCAGLGGGSLIYANIFLEPPEELFDDPRWPLKKEDLKPYYKVAKEVLGARPVPNWKPGDVKDRRRIIRTELFEKAAKNTGYDSNRLDLIVFFGNDFDKPLPIGYQDKNRYGAIQTSCTYCAECDVGCNTHSKNTIDLNYLYVAEHRYNTEIKTEHLALKIVPLNDRGQEDSDADGVYGFHVYYQDLNDKLDNPPFFKTKRVVISSGTLGSTEMLLRCRDKFKTLPNVSSRLGANYSGNGDFLLFSSDYPEPADPNYGPVITQAIDHKLYKNFDRERAFIMEDAGYPVFAAWFLQGIFGLSYLKGLWKAIRESFRKLVGGKSLSSIGFAMEDLMSNEHNYHSVVHLCMGVDKSDGKMSLDKNGNMDIDWPYKNSLTLYNAILTLTKRFRESFGSTRFWPPKKWFPLPTWNKPLRKNITVHSLGGCPLGPDADLQAPGFACRADVPPYFIVSLRSIVGGISFVLARLSRGTNRLLIP